ncbi:MAG TPA: formimidoylglutamate deiminase [Steroidobacteraceae bacterium]|nr:formimidoylglutamate deiminase [Steroidobacteraceae bacterium]
MQSSIQSVHFESALLPQGWAAQVRVGIAGGVIASIERGVAPRAEDERASVGLPGLSNVHSHAFQRAMAGLTEHRGPSADSFWTWRELMYHFVGRITPDDAEAIAAHAFMEMLEAGFTRVGEFHYLHHDPSGKPYANIAEMAVRVAAAVAQTGIALTLLPVFYAHGGFGGSPPTQGQRRFINSVDQFARLLEASREVVAPLEHAVVGVAPHSLRAVTPQELAAVAPLAGTGPIHIHAAEQTREVEDCVAWSGQRPVEWLLASAPVDRRWCLVHSTHVTKAEALALARSGAVVGLCPITEANLGDGMFPAASFLNAKGAVGIGTDSNVLISAAQELRQLEYSQRLRDRMRNVLAGGANRSTGRTLYDAALQGGTQAMGARGGFEVGAPADFFSLDAGDVRFAGREGDQILDTFVFAGGERCIDCVWRAGRKVVSGGRHHARPQIEARYRTALARLVRA